MTLYPYQRIGIDFLASHPRAYLADGMGLGKTVQAISAANKVGATSTTVICPASAVPNWEREWQKWGGRGDLQVYSYSTLINRSPTPTDVVILDEAHYCKTPSAKRTKAALKLAVQANHAWLLSGTPMPNNPTELWPPIRVLWPHIAKDAGCRTALQWMETFCHTRPTLYGPKPYAVKDGKRLRAYLSTFMLRRTLADVGLDLPPLRVHLHALPPLTDSAALRALEDYMAHAEDEQAYTSTLRRLLGMVKAAPIGNQIADELQDRAYDKVVVLYYHRDVGERLHEALAHFGVVGLHGGTGKVERQKAIDTFQTDPKARVFLAQQTAAGIAINLTAASEIVLAEPAWSPDDNEQAIKRVHRIGQNAPCRARIFTLPGTLDEAVMSTLAQKTAMQTEVGLR